MKQEPAMPATSLRNPTPNPKQGANARRMAARLERAVDRLTRDQRVALRALAAAETAPDRAETPGLLEKTA